MARDNVVVAVGQYDVVLTKPLGHGTFAEVYQGSNKQART